MEEDKNNVNKKTQEHLSGRIGAPSGGVKPVKHGTPRCAGNKSFRRHNDLRFMITERRRELRKR